MKVDIETWSGVYDGLAVAAFWWRMIFQAFIIILGEAKTRDKNNAKMWGSEQKGIKLCDLSRFFSELLKYALADW